MFQEQTSNPQEHANRVRVDTLTSISMWTIGLASRLPRRGRRRLMSVPLDVPERPRQEDRRDRREQRGQEFHRAFLGSGGFDGRKMHDVRAYAKPETHDVRAWQACSVRTTFVLPRGMIAYTQGAWSRDPTFPPWQWRS